MNTMPDDLPPAPSRKGIGYWVASTLLVIALLVGLPMLALALIFRGLEPLVVLGFLIAAPGIVLVAVALFRPELLSRGFHAPAPDDENATPMAARVQVVLVGVGFVVGGLLFAATREVLWSLLAFIASIVVTRLLTA